MDFVKLLINLLFFVFVFCLQLRILNITMMIFNNVLWKESVTINTPNWNPLFNFKVGRLIGFNVRSLSYFSVDTGWSDRAIIETCYLIGNYEIISWNIRELFIGFNVADQIFDCISTFVRGLVLVLLAFEIMLGDSIWIHWFLVVYFYTKLTREVVRDHWNLIRMCRDWSMTSHSSFEFTLTW